MKRICIDAAMFLLLMAAMSFQHLPKTAHEALGVVLPALALLHLAANRAWFASLRTGRWSPARLLSAFVNIALLASLSVVTVSGLAIANHLFHGVFGTFWERSILAHQAHVAAAYWMIIFSGLHIGLHWSGLRPRFARFLGMDMESRRFRVLEYILASVMAVLGVYGSFLHRIGDRLMMKHIFGTAATRLPFAAFMALIFCIIGMYAVMGFILRQLIIKKEKKKAGAA